VSLSLGTAVAEDPVGWTREWVGGVSNQDMDGLCLAATDHRLKVLRSAAAPLPGKSLVVLDPHTAGNGCVSLEMDTQERFC